MQETNVKLRRRTFLGAGLSAAVTGSAISCGAGKSASPWRFFTAEEGQTVDAICEQLIPADQDPGAKEARVVNYIDIQLTRHFKRYRKTYREGIAAVDAVSRKKFGKRFVELPAGEQTETLAEVEESSAAFFELILTHTRQGFYGDPRHGGNRNRVSRKMIGLPFPPVRGREHYDQPKAG
jgi:gluconate 2-dehydrogenase gamma chain